MKTHRHVFFTSVCLGVFILSGCATPAINSNLNLTPESKGKVLKGALYLGLTEVAAIQTATSDSLSPTYSDANISSGLNTSVGGELGVWDNVDTFVNSGNGAATLAGVKVQFLGDPALTAKTGNISISVASAAAFGSARVRPTRRHEGL